MGYSNNPAMVRVDYFRPSGKWYETLEVDMTNFYRGLIHDAVRGAIKAAYPEFDFESWMVVCLEPYHQYSHPVILMPKKDT